MFLFHVFMSNNVVFYHLGKYFTSSQKITTSKFIYCLFKKPQYLFSTLLCPMDIPLTTEVHNMPAYHYLGTRTYIEDFFFLNCQYPAGH